MIRNMFIPNLKQLVDDAVDTFISAKKMEESAELELLFAKIELESAKDRLEDTRQMLNDLRNTNAHQTR